MKERSKVKIKKKKRKKNRSKNDADNKQVKEALLEPKSQWSNNVY